MIEVKSENDRNFMRIVGLLHKPTPWMEYEVDKANGILVREKVFQIDSNKKG
jgi:hypothetical protein